MLLLETERVDVNNVPHNNHRKAKQKSHASSRVTSSMDSRSHSAIWRKNGKKLSFVRRCMTRSARMENAILLRWLHQRGCQRPILNHARGWRDNSQAILANVLWRNIPQDWMKRCRRPQCCTSRIEHLSWHARRRTLSFHDNRWTTVRTKDEQQIPLVQAHRGAVVHQPTLRYRWR